jgi:hypothetical protein
VIFIHLIQSASSLPTDASALESSISALERDIKALETSSLPLEHLLPWFTGVVALGVAMELWVIWREWRDDMEAWGRGIIRPPERPWTAKFLVEIVSVVLITAGILGELWAGVSINHINGQLRGKSAELRSESDQMLALVTQEAGDAKNSATTAHKEADAAGVVAGNAQRKAGDALDQSNAANDAAGKAKETAGAAAKLADEANKKAEAARLTASRMQEALTPREAGTNGIQNAELELFSETKAVITFAPDTEPRDLAGNIIGILQRSRWDVLSASPDSPLRDGVFVFARTENPPQPSVEAARLLCYVLKDNHVGCETWFPEIYQASHWPKDVPLDAVLILVGRKPMAYMKWADNPDAQETFTRMEKEREAMSEDEKRDRNNILERRRDFLRQRTPKPK